MNLFIWRDAQDSDSFHVGYEKPRAFSNPRFSRIFTITDLDLSCLLERDDLEAVRNLSADSEPLPITCNACVPQQVNGVEQLQPCW